MIYSGVEYVNSNTTGAFHKYQESKENFANLFQKKFMIHIVKL